MVSYNIGQITQLTTGKCIYQLVDFILSFFFGMFKSKS